MFRSSFGEIYSGGHALLVSLQMLRAGRPVVLGSMPGSSIGQYHPCQPNIKYAHTMLLTTLTLKHNLQPALGTLI